MIIDEVHRKTLHGGTQAILGYVRQKCWILEGGELQSDHLSYDVLTVHAIEDSEHSN